MRNCTAIAFACLCFLIASVYAGPPEIGFRLEWRKGHNSPIIVERIECTTAYGKLLGGEALLSVGGIASRNQKALNNLIEKQKAGEAVDVVVQRGRAPESISI